MGVVTNSVAVYLCAFWQKWKKEEKILYCSRTIFYGKRYRLKRDGLTGRAQRRLLPTRRKKSRTSHFDHLVDASYTAEQRQTPGGRVTRLSQHGGLGRASRGIAVKKKATHGNQYGTLLGILQTEADWGFPSFPKLSVSHGGGVN